MFSSISQRLSRWARRQAIKEGGYEELLTAIGCGDVTEGDLIEIKGATYLYRGLNMRGGPGQSHFAQQDMPTPLFGPSDPNERDVITTFLCSNFPRWKKVGHISLEEWEKMKHNT